MTQFDAQGQLTSSGTIQSDCSLLLGAVGDASNNSLVLVQGGPCAGLAGTDMVGLWLDSTGAPLTPYFLASADRLTLVRGAQAYAILPRGAGIPP